MSILKANRIFARLSATRKQLALSRFVVYCIGKLCKKLTDRYLIESYSQFGEDRLLDTYFQGQGLGVYVDVGCNHPIAFSNTWKLYLRGWSGVAIDANEKVVAEYRRVRPRDVGVCAVVSNLNHDLDFCFDDAEPLTSGVALGRAAERRGAREQGRLVRRTPERLSTILGRASIPGDFDLLSIDVEGHEAQVLESLDIEIFRPRIMLVEMHGLDLSAPQQSPIYQLVTRSGYALVAYIGVTAVFERIR